MVAKYSLQNIAGLETNYKVLTLELGTWFLPEPPNMFQNTQQHDFGDVEVWELIYTYGDPAQLPIESG